MKLIAGFMFLIAILVSVVVAAAPSDNGSPDNNSQRYYVMSDNPALKLVFGARHDFGKAFSAELTEREVGLLKKLGVKLEPVGIFYINGKPTCNNNGVCEPELGENPSCSDCKSSTDEEEPIERRACYPTDQYPWGVEMVNGGSGGSGVLDTGVDTDHPDLKGNIMDCKDATKRKIVGGCEDKSGHGTHVAGTIAANGGSDGAGIFGVAPESKLMVVKVCGASGLCWGDDIAAGIRYAADNGAKIISMSLGGNSPDPLILDAIDYAVSNDVLVVAAAGNDGPENGSIDYPAADVNVIAVGAIDSGKNVPYWSSRGVNPGEQEFVIEEKEVEFGAPGVGVYSTWNDGCYAVMDGTSMATPHVSGLAAKVWSDGSADIDGDDNVTAEEVRAYLQGLAKNNPNNDLYTPGDDPATGFGLPVAPTE